jgi:hypothetical protein
LILAIIIVEDRLEVKLGKFLDSDLVPILVFGTTSLLNFFRKIGKEVLLKCWVFDIPS